MPKQLPEERGSMLIDRSAVASSPPDPDQPPPEPPEPPLPADAAAAAPPLVTDTKAGEVIDLGQGAGTYSLVKPLGKGGMAEVWLARREGPSGFQRDVALKRIRPDHLIEDEKANEFRRLFVDEARLAASLHHPNIAQVYDLQERGDGSYYLVMEYVAGSTLYEIIQQARHKGAHFSASFACYIAIQVAEALHYAARARSSAGEPLGIVHRDVNPKNIMLGESGEVKLLDFGIAYSYLENRDRTRTGLLKGTWSYMSPEQANGNPLDGRSDLFSVGIVLAELLSGRRPFDAGYAHETRTLANIMQADPANVDQVVTGLDAELARIIKKCLARDPSDRYDHGGDLARDLRAYTVNTHNFIGPAEAAAEVTAILTGPDQNTTRVREDKTSTTPAREVLSNAGRVLRLIPAPTAPPPQLHPAQPPAQGPSATRIQKREATRDKLRNPENPRPRLLKPLLVLALVAIAAELIVIIVARTNRGDVATTPTLEVVKTPAQERAEREAEERARTPLPTRPELAPVHDPNAALAAATGSAPPPSTNPGATTGTPVPVAPTPLPTPAATPTPKAKAPRRAAAPPPESPPAPRRRSLDSSSAVPFADAAATATSSSAASTLPKGTLIPARLSTPADANNPGPVTATVTKDIVVGAATVVPSGTTLVCAATGTTGQNRIAITCDGIQLAGRTVPFSGTALGADQLRGIPVARAGGPGTGEPARNSAIDTAARLAGRLTGTDGATRDVLSGAVGAGQETARRATAPGMSATEPAPAGTRFFVFVNSFGGTP
jgi:serine/threonine-protein kinase